MPMDGLYATGAWMHRSGEDMEGLMPRRTGSPRAALLMDELYATGAWMHRSGEAKKGLQDFCTQGQASHFLTNPKYLHPCRQCRGGHDCRDAGGRTNQDEYRTYSGENVWN